VKVYRWTKKAELFMYSKKNCLAAGGGGKFAVRVGEDFLKGECGVSDTFENELLTDEEFTIKNFEIWGIN